VLVSRLYAYMSSTTLEMALFGFAGFVVGVFIFTLLWTWPLKESPDGREIVGKPLFWYLAVFVGLVTGTGFCIVRRML
jgi:hypothetical protein